MTEQPTEALAKVLAVGITSCMVGVLSPGKWYMHYTTARYMVLCLLYVEYVGKISHSCPEEVNL